MTEETEELGPEEVIQRWRSEKASTIKTQKRENRYKPDQRTKRENPSETVSQVATTKDLQPTTTKPSPLVPTKDKGNVKRTSPPLLQKRHDERSANEKIYFATHKHYLAKRTYDQPTK